MEFRKWLNEGNEWKSQQPYRGYSSKICDTKYLIKLADKSPSCVVVNDRGKGSHKLVYKQNNVITTIPSNISPQICKNVYNAITMNCGD